MQAVGEPFQQQGTARAGSRNCQRGSAACRLGAAPTALPMPWCPGSSSHLCASSLKQEKGPDLEHGSGILSCIPRWDTRPPASSLLRTPLGDQRLSTVTSSCCPSVPAVTADAVPLMQGTIPRTKLQPWPRGCPISGSWRRGTAAPLMSQHQNTGQQSGINISGWVGSSEFPWMPTPWLKAEP